MKAFTLVFALVTGYGVSGAPQSNSLEEIQKLANLVPADPETLDIKYLEKKEGYNVVEVPGGKYVCSILKKMDMNIDPLKGWQDEFEDGFDVLQKALKSEDFSTNILFNNLMAYLNGANGDGTILKMTSPIVSHFHPIDEVKGIFDYEMCIWTGSEWEEKALPIAVDTPVYEKMVPSITFLGNEFTGWTWSNEDWLGHFIKLGEALNKDGHYDGTPNAYEYYTASFDSPFINVPQRHAVMTPLKKE